MLRYIQTVFFLAKVIYVPIDQSSSLFNYSCNFLQKYFTNSLKSEQRNRVLKYIIRIQM